MDNVHIKIYIFGEIIEFTIMGVFFNHHLVRK